MMSDAMRAVHAAEDKYIQGDVEGFLALFRDDAQFCIPGGTPLSGDHDPASFRPVLERIAAAVRSGSYKPELICRYADAKGAVSIFDNHVTVNGEATKYHSVHEWIMRDGKVAVLLVYLHEYELFEAAWL